VTGDKFPSDTPFLRTGTLNTRPFPPYPIWAGDLRRTRPGDAHPDHLGIGPRRSFRDGWLNWQVNVDAQYGQRANEIFGGIWPVAKPVFDAVSLGIQTVGTLAGLWSLRGKSQRRPIGTQRDPNDSDGFTFNPITIALNADTALSQRR
jgi:hypothetical protein